MNRVYIGKACVGSREVIEAYIREYRGPYDFCIVPLDNGDYRLDFYRKEYSWKEKLWNWFFN